MKIILGTAIFVALADAAVKLLSHRFLVQNSYSLGQFVQLYLVKNAGMAFGLLSGKIWPLVLPPLLLVLGFFLLRKTALTRMEKAAVGLIVGGFIGNWGERLLFGSVTDMFYFPWLPFFVCNISDIAICGGAALAFIALILRFCAEKKPKV